jgi:hypothetical protein
MKFSRVIEIIIVLNVTGLFSFFAPPAGVKIWVITAVMMTLFGLYITFNIFSLIKMMSITRILVMQFNIVLVWPLLTGLYSNFVTLDAVLYVVFPFFLISASAILVFRNGIKVMNRIILISIALTGIGALANIFFPDYFIAVGILADTNVFDQKGRISGFLMQPNSFGMVSVILLIGYLLVQQPSNFDIVFYIVFMSTLFCILLSGSRSALIAVGLVACFYYYNLIRNGINSSSSVIIKNILFLVLSLFIAGTLTFSLQEEITSIMGSSQLFDRIELYFSGKLSDSDELSQDGSVAPRIEAQS